MVKNNFPVLEQLELQTSDYQQARAVCMREMLGKNDYSEVRFNKGNLYLLFELRNEVAKDTPLGKAFVDATQDGNGSLLL